MSKFSDWLRELKEELGAEMGQFKPGNAYYTTSNESITVMLEDVSYYAEWIDNGVPNQLHILHASDDDRIVGFSVWWLKDLVK